MFYREKILEKIIITIRGESVSDKEFYHSDMKWEIFLFTCDLDLRTGMKMFGKYEINFLNLLNFSFKFYFSKNFNIFRNILTTQVFI